METKYQDMLSMMRMGGMNFNDPNLAGMMERATKLQLKLLLVAVIMLFPLGVFMLILPPIGLMILVGAVVALVMRSKIKKRVAYNVARLKEDQAAGLFARS